MNRTDDTPDSCISVPAPIRFLVFHALIATLRLLGWLIVISDPFFE